MSPRTHQEKTDGKNSERETQLVCSQCYSELKDGGSHECDKKSLLGNVESITDSNPQKQKHQLLSMLLKVKETGGCFTI